MEVEAAIASREVLGTFNGLEQFRARGLYVLIAHVSTIDHRHIVRPGAAGTKTLNDRLRFHLGVDPEDTTQDGKTLLGWDTAVLYRRLHIPFSQEQTDILETLLHSHCDDAVLLNRVGNRRDYRASDPAVQKDLADRLFPALLVGLRLAGVDLRTQSEIDQQAEAKAQHRPGAGR